MSAGVENCREGAVVGMLCYWGERTGGRGNGPMPPLFTRTRAQADHADVVSVRERYGPCNNRCRSARSRFPLNDQRHHQNIL